MGPYVQMIRRLELYSVQHMANVYILTGDWILQGNTIATLKVVL